MQRRAYAPFTPINRMTIPNVQESIYYQPEPGVVFKLIFLKK